MKKKKYIGQLISIKFTDRETPIFGYVIDYNDEWTLMKYNPVDYIIDGFILLRHKNIEGFRRSSEEKWSEKVINLKGLQPEEEELIPITNLETILNYLTENFGVFQVYTKSESVCYLGRLKTFNDKVIELENLTPKGRWNGILKLKMDEIRVIEFDTDYIHSLKLVAETLN